MRPGAVTSVFHWDNQNQGGLLFTIKWLYSHVKILHLLHKSKGSSETHIAVTAFVDVYEARCRAMLAELDAVSDVALLLMPIIFAVGRYRRRCRQPQSTHAATKTTQDAAADRTSSGLGCTGMSQCTCTIILYRPTPNNEILTTSQPGRSTGTRTCSCLSRNHESEQLQPRISRKQQWLYWE